MQAPLQSTCTRVQPARKDRQVTSRGRSRREPTALLQQDRRGTVKRISKTSSPYLKVHRHSKKTPVGGPGQGQERTQELDGADRTRRPRLCRGATGESRCAHAPQGDPPSDTHTAICTGSFLARNPRQEYWPGRPQSGGPQPRATGPPQPCVPHAGFRPSAAQSSHTETAAVRGRGGSHVPDTATCSTGVRRVQPEDGPHLSPSGPYNHLSPQFASATLPCSVTSVLSPPSEASTGPGSEWGKASRPCPSTDSGKDSRNYCPPQLCAKFPPLD